MSEPKGKRGITSTEFYDAAQRLNAEITNLLLRDFGAKPSCRDLWSFCHNAKMSSEDKLAYTQLCEKYHIDVEASYPLWLIEHYREHMLATMDELLDSIDQANGIYVDVKSPNALNEFHLRRSWQWRAIGCCRSLSRQMRRIIETLPVDANKYMRYVDQISKELDWLKSWKKSDNRLLEKIRPQPP